MPLSTLIFLFTGTIAGGIFSLKAGTILAKQFHLYSKRKLGHGRKGIRKKIPLIGGFALAGGALLGILLSLPVSQGDALLSADQITTQLQATMLAIFITWLGGLIADRNKRPSTTILMVSHGIAILVLMASGVRIRAMTLW